MSLPLILILSLGTLQVFMIMFYVIAYRKWLTEMSGMLISMALGMTVGLLVGTILGVMHPSHLFETTVYAALTGLAVGFLSGMPVGFFAVVDGMLSGVMGGMMGAMLGNMVAMTKPDATIKLMALLVIAILIIVLYAVEDIVRRQSNQPIFSFIKHLFIYIFIVALLFVGLNKMGPVVPSDIYEHHNDNMNGVNDETH